VYENLPKCAGEKRERKPNVKKDESPPPPKSYGEKGIPPIYGQKPARTTDEKEVMLP
jgi:hypothetical protein